MPLVPQVPPAPPAPPQPRRSPTSAVPALALGAVALGLAVLGLALAIRTRALRDQSLRAREDLVRTVPGDWILIDSLQSLTGVSTPLVSEAEPLSTGPADRATPSGDLTLYLAFAPECAICQARAPLWRRVASRAAADAPALRLLAIAALTDTGAAWRDSAAAFLAHHQLSTLPTAVAPTRRTQRGVTLRAVPQTFLADAAGRVWWAARDSADTAWLADSLLVLLDRVQGRSMSPQSE